MLCNIIILFRVYTVSREALPRNVRGLRYRCIKSDIFLKPDPGKILVNNHYCKPGNRIYQLTRIRQSKEFFDRSHNIKEVYYNYQ
jgi:hypothetical protein